MSLRHEPVIPPTQKMPTEGYPAWFLAQVARAYIESDVSQGDFDTWWDDSTDANAIQVAMLHATKSKKELDDAFKTAYAERTEAVLALERMLNGREPSELAVIALASTIRKDEDRRNLPSLGKFPDAYLLEARKQLRALMRTT